MTEKQKQNARQRFSQEAKRNNREGSLLSTIEHVLKIVGLPSLVLASIIPITNLYQSIISDAGSRYLQGIYVEYISNLIEQRELDRARSVQGQLEGLEKLNLVNQISRSRLYAAAAFEESDDIFPAIDSISILLRVYEERPWYFPVEISELEYLQIWVALANIYVENGLNDQARLHVDLLGKLKAGDNRAEFLVKLTRAKVDINQYQYSKARILLDSIVIDGSLTPKDKADFLFQKAKLLLFERSLVRSIEIGNQALKIYQDISDDLGELRVINNLAIAYEWQGKSEQALRAYQATERVARKLDNSRALARALSNIGGLLSRGGKIEEGFLRNAEAHAIFLDLNNQIGIATTASGMSGYYTVKGDSAQAIKYRKMAIQIFAQLGDIRGLSGNVGSLADYYRDLGEIEERQKYYFMSWLLYRHTNNYGRMETVNGLIQQMMLIEADLDHFSLFEAAKAELSDMLAPNLLVDFDFELDIAGMKFDRP